MRRREVRLAAVRELVLESSFEDLAPYLVWQRVYWSEGGALLHLHGYGVAFLVDNLLLRQDLSFEQSDLRFKSCALS